MKRLFFISITALVLVSSAVHAATLPSSCITLNFDLRYQASDVKTQGNVSLLQSFLYAKGYLSVKPTGYFGTLTLAALKSFQKANGLYAAGFMGPQTRAKISTLTCTSNNAQAPAISTTSPSSPLSSVQAPPPAGNPITAHNGGGPNPIGGSSGGNSVSVSPPIVLPDPKEAYLKIKAEYDAATTYDAFIAVSEKYASADRLKDVTAQKDSIKDFSEDDKNEILNSIIKSAIPTVAEFGQVAVTQNGTVAALLITSGAASGKDMTGTVVLLFENGAWKLHSEQWQNSHGSGIEPLPSGNN